VCLGFLGPWALSSLLPLHAVSAITSSFALTAITNQFNRLSNWSSEVACSQTAATQLQAKTRLKNENAFSPLPARTKACNADMTACLPLQECIVQTQTLEDLFKMI
jgi:hypothetical protein